MDLESEDEIGPMPKGPTIQKMPLTTEVPMIASEKIPHLQQGISLETQVKKKPKLSTAASSSSSAIKFDLEQLPNAGRYERSYLHRDTITLITFAPYQSYCCNF